MEKVPVFVGLDYHRKSVRVCVVDGEGTVLVNRTCGNSVAEIGETGGAGRISRRAAAMTLADEHGSRPAPP